MTKQKEELISASGSPRSPIRVMDILQELAQAPDGLPLARIYGALELPKTSTYSLLKALELGGFITQFEGGYRLGPEAFRLASAISQRRRFPDFVRPVLEKLAKSAGETILLGVLDGNGIEIKYVDVVESIQPLRFIVGIGDKRPLYSSTTGKILLSYFSETRLQDYLGSVKRVQFTKKTLTNKADLLADISSIRAQIWAANIDGTTEGLTSFGAPIFEDDRRIIGAVVIAGPAGRMSSRFESMKTLVMDAGKEMSRLLNCSGPYPPENVEPIA